MDRYHVKIIIGKKIKQIEKLVNFFYQQLFKHRCLKQVICILAIVVRKNSTARSNLEIFQAEKAKRSPERAEKIYSFCFQLIQVNF